MSNEVKITTNSKKAPTAKAGSTVKSVKVLGDEPVEEEILHAIAGAVVDYVNQGKEVVHQVRFAPNHMWVRGTRIAQLNHLPLR
ncbi:MAG: hypothetical protein FWG08_00855 [Propionibacteriaceae bacterium]|jgi:hypothetical protein|nr:hypothetical protein [Propionibacteriaceae bacterium]